MGQYEVGELVEPAEPGCGGSSVILPEHNTRACMVALAAARPAPQRVAALTATLPHEHERALGYWQAELAEWPGLLMSAHGSARAMAQALPGLEVDTRRMRTNLDRLRATLPDDVAEEWLHPALVQHAGRLARTQANMLSGALSALGPEVQKYIAESMG